MARTSKTRFAVLGMLTIRSMTGYALRETIAESIGHFWQESFGQLYPALHALEAEGLITSEHQDHRSRREYRITEAGWDVLRSWLSSEPESLESGRSELLLQLFFGRHAERSVLAAHLERHRAKLIEASERYRVMEAAVLAEQSPDQPYWLATIRHGLAHVKAGLAWVDETAADLNLVNGEKHGSKTDPR